MYSVPVYCAAFGYNAFNFYMITLSRCIPTLQTLHTSTLLNYTCITSLSHREIKLLLLLLLIKNRKNTIMA